MTEHEPSAGALQQEAAPAASGAPGWLTPRRLAWPLAVFAVALTVRLLLVSYVNPDPADGRYDDSVWYDYNARSIAAGKGYVWDPAIWVTADGSPVYADDTDVGPSAMWPPAYPALLAGIYKVTGDSLIAGKIANALLGAATALLVCLIGRRMFGETAGAIAGFGVTFLPSHIFFTAVTMSEIFFTFLFVLLLYLALVWTMSEQRPRLWQLGAIGFLTGMAALTRGELMLFPVVLFALFMAARRSWLTAVQWTAVVAVGMSFALLPWIVRNRIQMDAWIPGTTGMGRVLWQAHNPDADGGDSLDVLIPEQEFSDLPRPEREIVQNRELREDAVSWALDHPWKEVELFFRRIYRLYRNDNAGVAWVQSNKPWFERDGADRLMALSNGYYFAILGLAIAGAPAWLAMRRHRSDTMLLLAPIAYYTLLFGVFFIGTTRYHQPLLPLFVLLAAAPVALLLDIIRTSWRGAAAQMEG